MGSRYLLDTNVVIDFMTHKLPPKAVQIVSDIIDREINLSFINKIELLGFPSVEQDIIDFIEFSKILSIDENIINSTINIRKQHKIKLPDAIIAATAIANNLTLATHNIKDFIKIEGLKLWNPFE